ncbi:hypothetical protein [Ferrimonas kyonanensis]|uniref:hypothetical protein n=1 Tax=Ferrimonas kyonanensis TaxID=364763 RepID=UPI0004175901|nr:hypothetical protein [Ferrimonas kyonanensis]
MAIPPSNAAGPDNPAWKHVDQGYIDLNGKSESTGIVTISLGRRINSVQQWMYACAIDANGNPVTKVAENGAITQLYPKDPDGTFAIRAAKQLGKSVNDLTEQDKGRFFGTDCVSNNTLIDVDGVQYPKLLQIRARASGAEPDSDFADVNNDGIIINYDAAAQGIATHEPSINSKYPTTFEVNLDDVELWLNNVGDALTKGTSRPDLFQQGHFSAFDVFRYVDYLRSDLEITITAVPYNFEGNDYPLSELNTYEFTVNWDVNGDGIFDASDNQFSTSEIDDATPALEQRYDRQYPAYYNSNRWHFKFNNSRGYGKGDRTTLNGQNYIQIDRFLAREDQELRFFPELAGYTERREWLMKHDIKRHLANGGKINVPNDQAYPIDEQGRPYTFMELPYFLDGDVYDPNNLPTPIPYAAHMKVTPHNLRSDMYQPGVITLMDIFLSANDHIANDDGTVLVDDPGTPTFAFSFWPVLSSGAIVNQFGLDKAPLFGQSAGGIPGGGIMIGFGSFFSSGEFGANVQDCRKFNIDGEQRLAGNGTPIPGVDQSIPYQADRLCLLNFKNNGSGGYFVPDMLSAYQMPYGMERFSIMPYPIGRDPDVKDFLFYLNESYDFNFNRYESRIANNIPGSEGSIAADTATVRRLEIPPKNHSTGNAPLLNQTHFGWKIADCTQCHNDQKDPKGHGGSSWPVNSAEGFDNVQPYYCASCHGNNGAPQGHGAIATCYWCHAPDSGLKNHGAASSNRLLHEQDWIANIIDGGTRNPNDWGNFSPYGARHVSTNSYYDTDKTWPDPWACGTCHQDQSHTD